MNEALLIFSRYPRLGRVKTRLSPLLGPAGCLRFHQALLLDTVERLGELEPPCYLFLGDCSQQEMECFAADYSLPADIRLFRQQGDDLGQRMWSAYCQVQPTADRVVLLGCDTPSLPLDRIRQAFSQLDEVPMVVGPTEDGGYYLMALARPLQAVFQGIDWGTSAVLEQTLTRAKGHGCRLLGPWYDVDTESDLSRLREDLAHSFPGFPRRTMLFLESLEG